jgi:hypothetical protein
MPVFLGEANLALELSLWVGRDCIMSNDSELGTYETKTLSRSSLKCSHLKQELCKFLAVAVMLESPYLPLPCEI